jgi:hypothetical protein
MNKNKGIFLGCLCFWALVLHAMPEESATAVKTAAAIDPVVVASNKERALWNVFHCMFHLAKGEQQGEKPADILNRAFLVIRLNGTPYSEITKEVMLGNFTKCKSFGIFTPDFLAKQYPQGPFIIRAGPYIGREARAVYILPPATCPELERKIFNIEIVAFPESENEKQQNKSFKKYLASKLHEKKLLSENSYNSFLASVK